MTLGIKMLGISITRHYAECLFLFVFMLSVVMLNVVILKVMGPQGAGLLGKNDINGAKP
jgi:hypothetical protein